jgi:hypothetical protein
MFWVSSRLIPTICHADIYLCFRSDNLYVFLQFSLASMPVHGIGVWKFNTAFLKDEEFCDKVCVFWQSCQDEKLTFPLLVVWWDAAKTRLKCLIHKYSDKKASSQSSRIHSLTHTLFHLKRRQSNGDNVTQFIKEVNDELEHLRIAQGVRILLALFSLFERYQHASGAKLNVSKSHGLLFGSWKDCVNMPN